MREHYTFDPEPYPWLDIALAVIIGVCLAMCFVTWWST